VKDGRRQFFRNGEPMPHATLLGVATMWQKLKGEQPSHKIATVWKLVDYEEPSAPPSPATDAEQDSPEGTDVPTNDKA
jgi:hypothetical protein